MHAWVKWYKADRNYTVRWVKAYLDLHNVSFVGALDAFDKEHV